MHYVIGDIHGCYDELMRLLAKINNSDPGAVITFVGDFIDRGPKVIETLQWMIDNITPDGKYRCVLGNHEDMILSWWKDVKDKWIDDSAETINSLPEIDYHLDEELKQIGKFTREYMEKIVVFLEKLPLRRDYNIISPTGKEVTYIVAHASVPREGELIHEGNEAYLWSRQHYWGFPNDEGKVLVHGHTPTISHDYLLRNSDGRPGMIVYSNNAINVDSGCCFFSYGYGEKYPCFLSAICLETLEEYYSDALEERFHEYLSYYQRSEFGGKMLLDFFAEDPSGAVEMLVNRYTEGCRMHNHSNSGGYDRNRILEKLGLLEEKEGDKSERE